MILVILLIEIKFFQLYFEARWDAEAFKEGESNHKYKRWLLIMWLGIVSIYFIIGYFLHKEQDYFWWLKLIILILIYPCIRYTFFDFLLNHFRGLDNNYKTNKGILKFISLFFGVVVLPTIYFLI